MYKFMVDAESAELWNSKLTLSSRANEVHGMDYTKDVKYLNELGIYTVYDLLTYRPECYAYTPKSWKDIPFKKRMNEYDLKDSFGIKTYNQDIENNAALNSIMKNLLLTLPPIKDFLPASVINNAKLMPLDTAIRQFQYPDNEENLSQSLHRLAFNELFLIQCGLKMIKRKTTLHRQNYHCGRNGELLKKVIASLPFTLTGDQERAFETITRDMETPYPMRRLVQGDVGNGKTVVAMLSLVKAVENGFQGAMLAPTEILAIQHYNNFVDSLSKFGIRVGLLSAKVTRSKKAKREIYEKIANHELDIVVGTHALIQDDVKFDKLGLVITDEQHRFGVSQRAKLSEKSNITPDVLAMTATPIPRTLSLTLYGDLDVSIIKQMPAGRKPIKTEVKTSRSKSSVYRFVRSEIMNGRQAYVVCPLIQHRSNSTSDLKSSEEIYKMLIGGIFKDIPCALIHGKIKAAEKDAIMEKFSKGEIKLLVSTTVIEVGVNVPNATVMVIENAERFGLAQLHQLRGRVGRGNYQSYCILISNSDTDVAKSRLGLMENTTDGFKLAEEDIKLRGAGQLFGEKQFGLSDLKFVGLKATPTFQDGYCTILESEGIFSDMSIWQESWKVSDEIVNSGKYEEYLPIIKEYIELTYRDKFDWITKV